MAECVRRKNVKQFHAFVPLMGHQADNLISSERLASLLRKFSHSIHCSLTCFCWKRNRVGDKKFDSKNKSMRKWKVENGWMRGK